MIDVRPSAVISDDEIKRALVIIRNPMAAIPSFFNHIYEMQNNLPVHSQRAPVADWIEWRDRLAMDQITKFGKFVDYWMERFDSFNGDRIFISYEVLTDDNDGPAEAALTYPELTEAIEPAVKEEAVFLLLPALAAILALYEAIPPEPTPPGPPLETGPRAGA